MKKMTNNVRVAKQSYMAWFSINIANAVLPIYYVDTSVNAEYHKGSWWERNLPYSTFCWLKRHFNIREIGFYIDLPDWLYPHSAYLVVYSTPYPLVADNEKMPLEQWVEILRKQLNDDYVSHNPEGKELWFNP